MFIFNALLCLFHILLDRVFSGCFRQALFHLEDKVVAGCIRQVGVLHSKQLYRNLLGQSQH